jgi:hypothetical protein
VTGREMISAGLRLIGALAPGESPTASEATDGLATLNRMLDSLSNEGLVIHAVTSESPLTLTAGDGSVTLGASGDITTRPLQIKKAIIRDGSTDYPVRLLTLEEYAAIPDKSLQSTHPSALYDDGGHPQRTLTLWPVPSAAHSLVLFTERALTQIATLDTSVSLPPGYDEMLTYNLAIRLSPEYGRPVPAEVALIASESKANIKRTNHRPALLECDPSLIGIGGSSFDINTGGYR